MDNHKEIKAILQTLANGFPNFAPSNPGGMIDAYTLALDDVEVAALRDAAKSLMTRSKFFPSIAELRVESLRHNHYRPGPDKLRAEAFALGNKFAAGKFDPNEWERLAARFETAGRTEAAASLHRQMEGRRNHKP